MTNVKIIADSTSWLNKRLTTFILEYPRYIHSEILTHRMFSKNSASSRAIPIEKFIKMVQDNPVKPLWTENQKGMQGPVITNEAAIALADINWNNARDHMVGYAHMLNHAGIHKQNINRLLEPWMHIKIILTGTEFDNWFELRDHPAAHPEIQVLARLMKHAMDNSTPTMLQPNQWHIPFGDNIDGLKLMEDIPEEVESTNQLSAEYTHRRLKVSVARCARVSYNNFDGTSDPLKDIELYEKLVVSKPLHASPAEHQARVPTHMEVYATNDMNSIWASERPHGEFEGTGEPNPPNPPKLHVGKYVSNLNGWIQLRKLIEAGEF